LGGATNKPSEYEGVDIASGRGVDLVCDLQQRWPIEDDSVGIVRAWEVLEQLRDPIHVFKEAWRVLAPGGMFMVEVPSTDGRGAWQNPSNISFFNQNSFWYYSKEEYAKQLPTFKGAFYPMKLATYFPTEFHKANEIPFVRAHLCAVKQGMKAGMLGPGMSARQAPK